jgi:hypothetical protein
VLLLFGAAVLAFMIWEPQVEGRNVNADIATIYLRDPFLVYLYVGSVPFFYGLYQAFRLLGFMDVGQAFTPEASSAARRIKLCALALIGFIVGGEAFILMSESDDHAGPVMMGVVTTFACIVTATAAALVERVLQGGVALKSEHDLTV